MENTRTVELIPDWKSWFWSWTAGVLLLPLLGSGLILLWYTWRRWRSVTFEIHDRFILRKSRDGEQRVDLTEIRNVKTGQGWIEQRLGLGTVTIVTGTGQMKMPGMVSPGRLSEMIMRAAEAERQRLTRKPDRRRPDSTARPGTLERMDYLTGLWQQGLIDDEEFNRERKHFE